MKRITTDHWLFGTIIGLLLFGIFMVYSSTVLIAGPRYDVEPNHFIIRQVLFALAGLGIMTWLRMKDYRDFRSPKVAFISIAVVVFLLLVVYVVDSKNHRWFAISGVGKLQPSEFAKPALILFIAFFLSWRSQTLNNARFGIGPTLLISGVIFLLVAVSDLGTALVLLAGAASVYWCAGLERKYVLRALYILPVVLMVAIVSRPYRIGRFIEAFDPGYKITSKFEATRWIRDYVKSSNAPGDPNYQVRQAIIGMGDGGVLGLGPMQGRQKVMYLPEAQTDMIYAVIGEEWGILGTIGVLAAFLIILWRGSLAFIGAPDDYGRYIALGALIMILFQAFFNMTVTLGIGPTKGIPLPLVSYGGSSLLSTMTLCGLLLSVSDRKA